MPMQMGWRWYGEGNDKISLSDIKQIPGVTSIVWALHDKMPGEIWEVEEIEKVKNSQTNMGLTWTLLNLYIRPDHGRHLWDEKPGNVRPGYGFYDRALGIMYMLGVWDMLDKLAGK